MRPRKLFLCSGLEERWLRSPGTVPTEPPLRGGEGVPGGKEQFVLPKKLLEHFAVTTTFRR